MAFGRNNTVREYTIDVSTSLTVPEGAYVEYEMVGGGGGGSNSTDSGTSGGNTILADDATTIDTADGGDYGMSGVYSTTNNRWLYGGHGIGGTGQYQAQPGQIAVGSHTMTSTSLVCTVGSGGAAGAAASTGPGRDGILLLRIWPYGQPSDGLPAQP